MAGTIEVFFKDLMSALQMGRLYDAGHPQFKKAVEKTYASLEEVLKEKGDFVIGIVGEEIAYEKEIFFELSRVVKPMIVYLKEKRGIERIGFCRGITQDELSKFIVFLTLPKDEVKGDPADELKVRGVRNITIGKLKAPSAKPLKSKAQAPMSYLTMYEDSVATFAESMDRVLNEQEIDRLALRITVSNVMENLVGRYQDFLNFAIMKRYDQRTSLHIVNVSVLAMYFSSKLGFSKEEILDIGTAALFHDIGKMYISRKIIQKPGKLTDEEFSSIKSHVVVGAEILLNYTDALGSLPVVACFEHHIKYDLSGYPKLTYRHKPHIVSMITCICDVYDALSQRRSYKNDYPPEMIYDIMNKDRGKAFHPELLDKFFQTLGVWPIGTIVALSDQRVAVVREQNPDDIFSPIVEVISPLEKKERIDLKTVKDRLKIERSLNPLTEGKPYRTAAGNQS